MIIRAELVQPWGIKTGADLIQPWGNAPQVRANLAQPPRGCLHCGSPLVPVANPDGLRIIGCKQCRYSRIMEG